MINLLSKILNFIKHYKIICGRRTAIVNKLFKNKTAPVRRYPLYYICKTLKLKCFRQQVQEERSIECGTSPSFTTLSVIVKVAYSDINKRWVFSLDVGNESNPHPLPRSEYPIYCHISALKRRRPCHTSAINIILDTSAESVCNFHC